MERPTVTGGQDAYLPANIPTLRSLPYMPQGPGGYGYGIPDHEISDSQRNIHDYLEIVLSRIRLVACVFAAVLLICIAFILLQTPLYTSQAIIEPEGYGGIGKELSTGSGEKSLYEKSVGLIPNQIEIFSSSSSLANAFRKRMNYEEFPELKDRRVAVWEKITGMFSIFSRLFGGSRAAESSDDKVMGNSDLGAHIPFKASAMVSKKSGLITVSLTAESPKLAKKMLETYLEVYLERNLENRRAESLEAAEWLKKELDHINVKLAQSQGALVAFTIDNGIVDSRDGGISQVMSMVNKTVESRIKSKESHTKLKLLENEIEKRESVDFIPSSGDKNEHIGKLKQDLAMMESEYAQMRVIYSENYPKLVLMKRKIKFLKDRIVSMEKDVVSASKELAAKEDEAAKQSLDVASTEASRVQALESQYNTLKKEVDTNLEFQKLLLKEYNQMHIRARTIANNLRMIDPPTLPLKPSWPKTKLMLLVGCLLGLVGGIASAFVANAFDDTIKQHTQIEKDYGLRKLGIVPDAAKDDRLHSIDESNGGYEFIAHDKPKSPMSDAIKNVQTSIFLTNIENPVRSIVVSSSIPSEGKTLVSVSLATSMTTGSTKNVVLVDGDMRKPRVHKALGLSETGLGLADFLNGNNLLVDQIIHTHRIPGFFYVTAGAIPHDPISLLSADRMKSFLAELKDRFDYVVMDSPPILGFSDTPIIASCVDGLILVTQSGRATRWQLSEAARSILSLDGTRILGVIINKADMGYGYGYGYRYRYGLGRYYGGRYGGKYGGYNAGAYYYGPHGYYSDKG